MTATIHRLPSATPSADRYQGQFLKTIKRRLKGGTRFEFWFKPDAKLRPEAWDKRHPPSIRLPRDKNARTGLDPATDPTEKAAAFREAAELFTEFNQLRNAPQTGGAWPRGTMLWLTAEWERSDWFATDLAENTKRLYRQQLESINEWAKRKAVENNKGIHPQVSELTSKAVSNFFHEFDDRPTKRRHVRRVLKNLCAYAIELGLRETNPVDGVVTRRTASTSKKMVLWTQQFVDACVEWAEIHDHPEAAAMVLLMWDCGRRPHDIFRLIAMTDLDRQNLLNGSLNSTSRPILYDAHRRAIMGWVHKTASYIEIPLDAATIEAIAHICPGPTDNRRHLFVHQTTGEPYTTQTWKWIWGQMRDFAAAKDNMASFAGTTWQKGRHSSIVRNKRAGLKDSLIITLSDHSDPATVYQHYWVADDSQAAEAKRQRREAEGHLSLTGKEDQR